VNPARRRWDELAPSRKRLIMALGVLDAGLRTWALVDLRKRTADEVNGPKAAWALALSVVSSAGVLPATYLLVGRRR
jgi:hypothetical protein